MTFSSANPVKIALNVAGDVTAYHHVPAIRLAARPQLAGVCDSPPDLLESRRNVWGCENLTSNYEAICVDPRGDAVIIATPNFTQRPIAVAAARHGKHVMCEKPLGLNAGEVREMYRAC